MHKTMIVAKRTTDGTGWFPIRVWLDDVAELMKKDNYTMWHPDTKFDGPILEDLPPRDLGAWKGKVRMSEDFNEEDTLLAEIHSINVRLSSTEPPYIQELYVGGQVYAAKSKERLGICDSIQYHAPWFHLIDGRRPLIAIHERLVMSVIYKNEIHVTKREDAP